MSEISSYFKKFDPVVGQILMSMTKKSLSLSDISSLGDLNGRLPDVGDGSAFNLSTETIGSNFGKDSGYVHSASVSSLNSSAADYFKTHGSFNHLGGGDDRLKVTRLLKELEDRKILIAELEKSNLNLRLQCAAAQSKISELRIKCEDHCRCCSIADDDETADQLDKSSRSVSHSVGKIPFQEIYRPSRCSSLQSLNFKTSTPSKNRFQRNVDKVTEWRSMLLHPNTPTNAESPTSSTCLHTSTTFRPDLAFPLVKPKWSHSPGNIPSPIPHSTSTDSSDDDDDDSENDDEVDTRNFPVTKYSRTYKNRKQEMENIIRSSWNDIAQMGKMTNDNLSKLYRKELPENFAKGTTPLLICLYEASHYANDLTNGLVSLELSMSKISEE